MLNKYKWVQPIVLFSSKSNYNFTNSYDFEFVSHV